MTLDEISIKFGTDKASIHPHKGHDYARHYDQMFSCFRNEKLKLLEIGVGGGESIQTWLEYFPKAKVYGVDNVRDTNQWNSPRELHERYTSICGDQSDSIFWKCFIADYGSDWDVVIDDGGHFVNQVVTTFKSMWPHVRGNGLYAIEDLGVAYGHSSVFVNGDENHMNFISDRMDDINLGEGIESLTLWKELAIFRKA